MTGMQVTIVGLGYIGLPTAAVAARSGFQVYGVDVNTALIDEISSATVQFEEDGLEDLINQQVTEGRLTAGISPQPSDVFVICVPTPFKSESGGQEIPEPDLSYVRQATEALLPVLQAGNLVIIESTSPVGTTRMVSEIVATAGIDGVLFAYCPERILPGNTVYELEHNDRIIGGLTHEAAAKAMAFYGKFVRGDLLETSAEVAEMCKLAENSFRDINIAFANELSLLAAEHGLPVAEVIELANRHPRVNILQPGVGVGGHCIAVDPWFLVAASPDTAKLIQTARQVNDNKPDWVVNFISVQHKAVSAELGRPAKVACLGLSYKPDIDDFRESPALKVARRLIAQNIPVVAVEPNSDHIDGIDLLSLEEALSTADLFVALVGHKQFRELSCLEELRKHSFIDFANII